MWPVPKDAQVRLVPDVDYQAVIHIVLLQVGDELGEESIIIGPVPIVSRIHSTLGLPSVGAPDIMRKQNEGASILACGLVVA